MSSPASTRSSSVTKTGPRPLSGAATAAGARPHEIMKRVELVLPPSRFEELKDALDDAGISGFTVREAKVFDKASRRRQVYHGSSYTVDFVLKVEVALTVPANEVARILRVLDAVVPTGPDQDGSVFVSDVVKAAAVTARRLGADASEP